MKSMPVQLFLLFFFVLILGCNHQQSTDEKFPNQNARELVSHQRAPLKDSSQLKDMRFIPAGIFYLGAVANDSLALEREYPRQTARVDSFYMDVHEVTNAQFAEFVQATNYVTVAEREINWEEMKKDLPPGTPKPADSLLVPGSLVFSEPADIQNLHQLSWWKWVPGASWKHPEGPDSTIKGKENYPVVHIAYEDAKAYANWAGKRLPTEAEWTWAAKGGHPDHLYPWGNEHVSTNFNKANYWTGTFPFENTVQDGYYGPAPVQSFAPNDFGLYEMAGNVWEITADKYNENYLKQIDQKIINNPQGATLCYDSSNPYQKVRVMKGGSFLCNDSYCASYRISAKMAFPEDSGTNHIGFRCVIDVL